MDEPDVKSRNRSTPVVVLYHGRPCSPLLIDHAKFRNKDENILN